MVNITSLRFVRTRVIARRLPYRYLVKQYIAMEEDKGPHLEKKYKISDPEIIFALVALIPLFLILLLKYMLPGNDIIQKYFSGFPQFVLIIIYFPLVYLIEKKLIKQRKTEKNKHKNHR